MDGETSLACNDGVTPLPGLATVLALPPGWQQKTARPTGHGVGRVSVLVSPAQEGSSPTRPCPGVRPRRHSRDAPSRLPLPDCVSRRVPGDRATLADALR